VKPLFFDPTIGSPDCRLCGLDKRCKTPKLPLYGEGRKKIFIVGEGPGAQEDQQGIPFIGEAGQTLRNTLEELGIDLEQDCWTTNAVNCRPFTESSRGTANRPPADNEIRACRTYVLSQIEKCKPELIIPLGKHACDSIQLGEGISTIRGFTIPDWKVYNAWVAPTFHPSFINREKRSDGYIETLFKKDLQRGLSRLGKPFPKIEIKYKVAKTVQEIEQYVEKCFQHKLVIIDWETEGKKPFNNNSAILCCSLSCDGTAVVFPVEHPNAMWSESDFKKIKALLFKLLTSSQVIKVAHNLKFERMWAVERLGFDFKPPFHCTMLMSYTNDERKGTNGLKFEVWVKWGDKDYDAPVKKYKHSMVKCPLDLLYRYSGQDAVYEYHLYKTYEKIPSIYPAYNTLLIPGVDSMLASERCGLDLDLKTAAELRSRYEKIIVQELKAIYSLPEVIAYKKKYPEFSITSSKQVEDFLYRFCNLIPPKRTKSGKSDSIDEPALKELDIPFGNHLVKIREYSTLIGTFIDGIVGNKDKGIKGVLYDDGKPHTEYSLHGTVTSRPSSSEPNLLNIPKREHPEIRKMYVAPPGYVMLRNDQSQWEVRVVQMYAKDETLGKEIWDNIDFHAEYAVKLLEGKKGLPDWKNIRHSAKNGFVFPTIYGSSYKGIAKSLWNKYFSKRFKTLEEAEQFVKYMQNDFFEKRPGIKEWQLKTVAEYEKKGYIESLFKRRRRAPLSWNEIINTPVQSVASDFTLLAWNRCTKIGIKVPLMIYDDLTCIVPEDGWLDYYYQIKKCMTEFDFDFINVPIEIESKVGYNWHECYPVEDFIKGEINEL